MSQESHAQKSSLTPLIRILNAHHPAISIQTAEEGEAVELIRGACQSTKRPLWTWNIVDGLRKDYDLDTPLPDTENPAGMLYRCATQKDLSVLVACDLIAHLEEPRTLRALRRLLERFEESGRTLVLIDSAGKLPEAVRTWCTPFEVPLPTESEIESLVRKALKRVHRKNPVEIDLTKGDYNAIVRNLAGLSQRQVMQVVRDVVAEDQTFDSSDLPHIIARKRDMLGSGGTLEFVESPRSLDEVGGLRRLKEWLAHRERSFSPDAESYGLTPPRGVLMLGVQGAGKSLCAKAIATAWGRPLVRLDPGVLYDRYVGETERRLRDALARAEAIAPVVLWIDEIEKAFASAAAQSTDGGLSQRMFGTLLTWMQDHREPVFLVATANNIDALPPELLRKGRFDEIFFVDLPRNEARRAIFEIHLRARDRDPASFDLDRLVTASIGYSGAEIEQAILASLHRAFAERTEPTTDSIVESLEGSPPLSVTMRERIEALRAWAEDRCVPAD